MTKSNALVTRKNFLLLFLLCFSSRPDVTQLVEPTVSDPEEFHGEEEEETKVAEPEQVASQAAEPGLKGDVETKTAELEEAASHQGTPGVDTPAEQ